MSPLTTRPVAGRLLSVAAPGLGRYRLMHTGARLASTISNDGQGPSNRERVVILGSGWAGYAFAQKLDPKKYERIMISPRSYFVFTPLLAGTTVGTLEFRAVVESVRRLKLDCFHQGWADDIDFARKTVRVEANTSGDLAAKTQLQPLKLSALEGTKGEAFDVPYDKLVIAVGSYSQTYGIEGVREHANFLRDVGDARKIRNKVLQCFEKASLPTTTDAERKKLLHFAVVGGGPTGIEFAAELHDLMRDDLRKLYPQLIKFVGITVYDVAPKVLPMFDQNLAKYALDLFGRDGIAIKTQHHLTRIRPDEQTEGCLKLKIRECGDEEVSASIVVWSTGLMQNPFIQKVSNKQFLSPVSLRDGLASSEVQLEKDLKTGSIITDPHLRIRVSAPSTTVNAAQPAATALLPDVFAIGDCAMISGQPLPATAQVASQKALHLAAQLNRGNVDEASSAAFEFRNWGTMTYVGNWKAMWQSRGKDDLKGWAAWVLWRTAYLTKSMSVRNKILVPVYWTMSWLFGRDISRF